MPHHKRISSSGQPGTGVFSDQCLSSEVQGTRLISGGKMSSVYLKIACFIFSSWDNQSI